MPTGIEKAVADAAIQSLVNWVDGFKYQYAGDECPGCHHKGTCKRHVGFIIGGHTQVSCGSRLARQGGLNPGCGCEWTQDIWSTQNSLDKLNVNKLNLCKYYYSFLP